MSEHNWHIAKDAQGPMGIFDADGKAIAMFTDNFTPSNGYAWDYPYDERTRIVKAMFAADDLLAALKEIEYVALVRRSRKAPGLMTPTDALEDIAALAKDSYTAAIAKAEEG